MGAVPESIGYPLGGSPARELERHTEAIRAHSEKPGPRRFIRVPTHAIGVAQERRRYPRASLCLPLRLTRVGETVEPIPVTLVTRNISSSGVYFWRRVTSNPGQRSSSKSLWWSARSDAAEWKCPRQRTSSGPRNQTRPAGGVTPQVSTILR